MANKHKKRKRHAIEKNKVDLLGYIPNDLMFLFTSLKFDRKHFIMFNTCCKSLLEKLKNDSWEKWENIKPSSINIGKLIEDGYRNFRINHLEFFIVNAKNNITNDTDIQYSYILHTRYGKIITLYNNNIYISNYILGNNKLINLEKLEYLKESYPFIAKSRGILVQSYINSN